jgi:(p)ppGpp synthase/HD superfamily hydrolase
MLGTNGTTSGEHAMTKPINTPTQRFADAVALAATLHADQARKGTEITYLSHLLGVASLVLEHGGSEDQAIAGLLHDAVEDAGGADTAELIRRDYGDLVADIVIACSDTDQHPKPPWQARKQAYLDHLMSVDERVLLVSLADKVHNCRSLATDEVTHGDVLWERFNATRAQSCWYYTSLREVFEARMGRTPLVLELDHAIGRIWG